MAKREEIGRLGAALSTVLLLALAVFHGALNAAEPGRALPHTAAAAQVLVVGWEGMVSLLVIEGDTHPAPTHLVTWQRQPRLGNQLQVAYVGRAFRAADGVLHIDGRGAPLAGPIANQWLPDSFAIFDDGRVDVLDDGNQAGRGRVEERILAADDAAQFRFQLFRAQVLRTGIL